MFDDLDRIKFENFTIAIDISNNFPCWQIRTKN